ncbi:MAG: potassium/proton antiporter [Bacteroidales bacterium]
MQIEIILLIISVLFFISILAGKAGYRLGVPALLLFLIVGMLCGSDGLGIHFENIYIAQIIGTVSLSIILFSGGMDTKISEIRSIIPQGIVLATVGVFLTAITTGVAIWWILGMTLPSAGVGFITSLLLAATMSSTDSASVFSILRAKDLRLKNNLRPILELESGSNDPMAYVLTITLINIIQVNGTPNYWLAGGNVLMQLIIGAVAGFLLGKLIVYIINKLQIDTSLSPILVLACCIFVFSATYFIKGNSYLAVYIAGVTIGNAKFLHKRSILNFFDGLSWLSQLMMFLTLGLLVNPRELWSVTVPGLIISFLMIFVTRPFSVFISLLPFRKMALRDKTFVSWVGLRGAVPIIFAIITLAEGVPHARLIFNIVFFCTLVSLIVQGTSLPRVAKWLKVAIIHDKMKKMENFDIEFSEEIKSITSEIMITSEILNQGNRLMDLGMPEKTLAIMVRRGDSFFVPTGKTKLYEGDNLLILTDNQEALQETYQKLGIS